MFITQRPTVTLQLHIFALFRPCCTSSFCTVELQLARFQLTRRIARSLGDNGASCFCRLVTVSSPFTSVAHFPLPIFPVAVFSVAVISDINFLLPFFPTVLFFVAEFYRCPIFRQPNLPLPFFSVTLLPLPLLPFTITGTKADNIELHSFVLQILGVCVCASVDYRPTYVVNLRVLIIGGKIRPRLSRIFFQDISEPTSCLHHLLPEPREHSIISRLMRNIPSVYQQAALLNVIALLYNVRKKEDTILRQMLTDFQNSFIVRRSSKFVIKSF